MEPVGQEVAVVGSGNGDATDAIDIDLGVGAVEAGSAAADAIDISVGAGSAVPWVAVDAAAAPAPPAPRLVVDEAALREAAEASESDEEGAEAHGAPRGAVDDAVVEVFGGRAPLSSAFGGTPAG